MLQLTQFFLRTLLPWWNGLLTRLVYSGSRVVIGKNFRTDSVPRILIDRYCSIVIGDNVEFRRNIEIRAHGQSRIFIGDSSRIDRGVRLLAANKAVIDIRKGVRIGLYTVLNGGDSISVGEKSLISGFVYLQTSMHRYLVKDIAVQDQHFDHAPVVLEEDTWLGTHVVVLPGVVIGKGSIVGSNAVVTKSIQPYEVVAGIPAKPINERR
jgi:acetyltransferase-like isoleucine patch superfamily enzyme